MHVMWTSKMIIYCRLLFKYDELCYHGTQWQLIIYIFYTFKCDISIKPFNSYFHVIMIITIIIITINISYYYLSNIVDYIYKYIKY